MAAPRPEQIEFRHDEWDAVVERAEALAAARRGWVNLYAEVEDEEGMARPGAPAIGLGAMFRTGGPTVPTATWVMPTGKDPGTVGIAHAARSKVLPVLVEKGIEPPAGCFRLQDNPRRGLVLRLPDPVATADVIAWMMEAIDELCPLQLTGHWMAEIHDR